MFSSTTIFSVALLTTLTGLSSSALIDCQCGRSFVQSKILSGKSSLPKSFPWMAALVFKSSGKIFCGGSLINSQFILTAGHCMINQDINSFVVVLAETDSRLFSKSKSVFSVSSITTHPSFSGPPNYSNDLSLIQLDRPVDIVNSTDISTICLPQPGPTVFGSSLIIAGWGFLANGGPQPTKLQDAVVRQQSQTYCQTIYGASKFTLKHLCASGIREGVCNGDSGGPLMLNQKQQNIDKSFIIGVVSYGVTCGDARYPAVFTRTQLYLSWIFDVTKKIGDYCSK